MISGLFSVMPSYVRSTSTSTSNPTLTPADALADTPPATDSDTGRFSVDVSQVKPLQATAISAADNPALRDMIAASWLTTHDTSAMQSQVPDNAPQNTYAQIKVNGQVVATLYNGGSAALTNAAGAAVSGLQDPPGLSGPDLAQWRADHYAKLLGGTVEKAPTAITQSQWTPRESTPAPTYSRAQLDAAWQAMQTEAQKAIAQQQYSGTSAHTGMSADFTA